MLIVRLLLILAILVVPSYATRHTRQAKLKSSGADRSGEDIQSDQQAVVNVYTDETCVNTKAQPITVPGPFAARCYTPEGGSLSWIFTCSIDPDTNLLEFDFSHWSTRGCTGNAISKMSFKGPVEEDGERTDQSGCAKMSVVSGGMPYEQYAKVRCDLGSAARPITVVRIEDEVPEADVEDIEQVADLIDDVVQN